MMRQTQPSAAVPDMRNYIAQRKREKKRWQRRADQSLEWLGGRLYYMGSEDEVVAAPPIPKPGTQAGGRAIGQPASQDEED